MLQGDPGGVFQSGREITDQELSEIQETVDLFPKLSRTELAATICENLGWVTPSGGLKLDACNKLLDKLESKGSVRLPDRREELAKPRPRKPISLTKRTEPQPDIVCDLSQLDSVRVEVVKDKESMGLWNEYMFRYHYLGYKYPFGTFMKYFVVSDQGILGCILFAGASRAIAPRDRWIGWGEKERMKNLSWVTNNSRFLIFEWVRVKNLASHVLGKTVRRIKDDWEERWGFKPLLIETFVDPRRYHGSCYKAANWKYLGMTTGEGLARKGKTYTTTPKMIFVNPLAKNFRSLLCSDRLEGTVEK